MEKVVYIGPDIIFKFRPKEENSDKYIAIVRTCNVSLSVWVSFFIKPIVEGGASVCTMALEFSHVDGRPVGLEPMSRALNCLTINKEKVTEVCCECFINGFLESEF